MLLSIFLGISLINGTIQKLSIEQVIDKLEKY